MCWDASSVGEALESSQEGLGREIHADLEMSGLGAEAYENAYVGLDECWFARVTSICSTGSSEINSNNDEW